MREPDHQNNGPGPRRRSPLTRPSSPSRSRTRRPHSTNDKRTSTHGPLALDKQKTDLDARAAALDGQAKQLAAQLADITASQFADGLLQVGSDIQRGKYHTESGSSCYWAKRRSSDPRDSQTNNLSAGPEPVVIDSAYCQSRKCGIWTKVG